MSGFWFPPSEAGPPSLFSPLLSCACAHTHTHTHTRHFAVKSKFKPGWSGLPPSARAITQPVPAHSKKGCLPLSPHTNSPFFSHPFSHTKSPTQNRVFTYNCLPTHSRRAYHYPVSTSHSVQSPPNHKSLSTIRRIPKLFILKSPLALSQSPLAGFLDCWPLCIRRQTRKVLL